MKTKGFTILELLLTMSIMVMVMTMIQSALAISSKVCTGGRDRAQLFHGARLAMDEMLSAFSNMEYASTGKYEFAVSSGDVDGYPMDSVDMVTLSPPIQLDSRWLAGEVRVRYSIGHGEDGVSVLQKEISYPTDEDADVDVPSVVPLVEGVVGMELSFYDEDGNISRGWDSSISEQDGSKPYEVVITLFLDLGKTIQPICSAAMLPTMKVKNGQNDGVNGGGNGNNGEPVPEMEGPESDFGGGGRRGGSSGSGGRGGRQGGGPGGGPGGGGQGGGGPRGGGGPGGPSPE